MPDEFVVLTRNESEQNRIFNNKTDNHLKQEEFTPQIPPELKAKRSVLIFKVDNDIFSKEEEIIIEEIEQKNVCVGKIHHIQKFPGNIIKITFDETIKAVKATE